MAFYWSFHLAAIIRSAMMTILSSGKPVILVYVHWHFVILVYVHWLFVILVYVHWLFVILVYVHWLFVILVYVQRLFVILVYVQRLFVILVYVQGLVVNLVYLNSDVNWLSCTNVVYATFECLNDSKVMKFQLCFIWEDNTTCA